MNQMNTYKIQTDVAYYAEYEINIPLGSFYFVDDDVFGRKYRIYETEARIELHPRGLAEVNIIGRGRVGVHCWDIYLNGGSDEKRRVFMKDELDKAIDLCTHLNKKSKIKVKKLV